MGAQWLSGRVLDSRPRGRGFEPNRRYFVAVLEQDTFILAYWSIALRMEHCFFSNNIKSKMGILNLIRKIYFNQKYFLRTVYVFINAGIGWNFNLLNVLCQITFPSCTLSDMDHVYNHVYTNIRQFTMRQRVLNVGAYWLALLFISLVNISSVI